VQLLDWGKAVNQMQLAQTTRCFKILRVVRLVRVVRSFHYVVVALRGCQACAETRMRMRRFILHCAFVRAHFHAEHELLRFVGRGGKADFPELARCILQSRTDRFKAMHACTCEEAFLDHVALEEKAVCEGSIRALQRMEAIVAEARDGGLLSSSEAEAMVHALHKHWSLFERRINNVRGGFAIEQHDLLMDLDGLEQDEPDGEAQVEEAQRQSQLCRLSDEAAKANRTRIAADAGRVPLSVTDPNGAADAKQTRFSFDSDRSSLKMNGVGGATPQVVGMTLGTAVPRHKTRGLE